MDLVEIPFAGVSQVELAPSIGLAPALHMQLGNSLDTRLISEGWLHLYRVWHPTRVGTPLQST